MNILFKGRDNIPDGVASYNADLFNVLINHGHQVYYHGMNVFLSHDNINEKYKNTDYDIYFSKFFEFDFYECTTIHHIHNAIIKSNIKERLFELIKLDNRYITVNSQYQRDQLIDIKDHITILPNCIDESLFDVVSKINKNEKSILYFGRLSIDHDKQIKTLVNVMNYLPNYTLDLVGYIERSYINEIEYIKDNYSNIRIINPIVDRKNKVSFINSYDIGVGVGRAALEMALCGLPVMIFGNGYAGWLSEDNIDILQKDNYTTRMFDEKTQDELVGLILQDINKKYILNRKTLVSKCGLNSNINIYLDFFNKCINNYY